MKQNYKNSFKRTCVILLFLLSTACGAVFGQTGKEIRWLRLGSMHHFMLNWGAEIELGRTGRVREQMDGMVWPAQFANQDVLVGKGLWIGCRNYQDRNRQDSSEPYAHKVIVAGPRAHDENYQFIPEEFYMAGRYNHPTVIVDGVSASNNDLNDIVDEIDETLLADRMIYNRLRTYVGITVTRKIYQFAQQNHDNYIVYDYVFKNTGIVDIEGNSDPQTLEDVYFFFQYRYGSGLDAFRNSYAPSNNINWGRNTVNQVVGIGPKNAAFEHRAQYSWYGPHSSSQVDSWGCPNPNNGKLAAVQYMGTVVLHADTSPQDQTDDTQQPGTTKVTGSDQRPLNFGSDMYDPAVMTERYETMSAGHPDVTHADQIGDDFADTWGTDAGGYSQGQGFGPYTMEVGDSIHIVLAEGVSGINRRKSIEVGQNWYQTHSGTGSPDLVLPDGSGTDDEDEYKRLWVQTGEDSILQSFRRAVDNFRENYSIPQPPPAPEVFEVQSGGDRITIRWSDNAERDGNFGGYEIYRAVGRPDTLYDRIYTCYARDIAEVKTGDEMNQYEDKGARRGFDYYYYIQTIDDGTRNEYEPGVSLKSSKFLTMTNEPAYLRRPAVKTTLDSIRVVPNPFNISSSATLQFGQDTPDRLAFYGLPPECIIKIYTERGDLVDTIEHTDGTADELWDSLTMNRQIIVSGLYIAYFEISNDYMDPATGQVLFKKGDNTIRKFVVIR